MSILTPTLFAAMAQGAAATTEVVPAVSGQRIYVTSWVASLTVAGTLKFQSDPQVNEVNTLTISASGGTFDLVVNGQTAANNAWNIPAATLQANIIALSNVAPGDIVVTGGPGNLAGSAPYTLTWAGALADTDMTITADATNLTGGAHTATVGTTTAGDGSLVDLTGAMKIGVTPTSVAGSSAQFATAAGEALTITSATGGAAGYVAYYLGS